MIAAFPGPWWIKSMSASRTSFTVTVALTAPFTFRSLAEGNATLDASARLVAAAPELLAACRLALREHGQSVLFSDAALAALEGAIASAEVHEDGDLTCPDCHGDGGAFDGGACPRCGRMP